MIIWLIDLMIINNELSNEGGCQSVSVGPYCTLDGNVQGPIGDRGNRQNTETTLVIKNWTQFNSR